MRKDTFSSQRFFIISTIVILVTGLFWFREILIQSVRLTALSGIISLVLCPICILYEKKFSMSTAALMTLATGVFLAISCITAVIIPLIKGIENVIVTIPRAMNIAEPYLGKAADYIDLRNSVSTISTEMLGNIGRLIPSITSGMNDIIGGFSNLIIAIVLAWYLLISRKSIALTAEMCIPLRYRTRVLHAAHDFRTEIGMYLRGQAVIAACVGFLASIGLTAIGIPYALPLGLTAGLLNMIPYLGPVIACIPVSLLALQDGILPTVLGIAVLIAVQQVDGLILSPRIVGSSTGFSPAVVLVAIFSFGAAWGIAGMLFAMPVLILIRTCVRVFVELAYND